MADYVLLGRTPHIGYFGFEKAQDQEICAELLERLDWPHGRRGCSATLSGGELQRVVLARALAQEAPGAAARRADQRPGPGPPGGALEMVDGCAGSTS